MIPEYQNYMESREKWTIHMSSQSSLQYYGGIFCSCELPKFKLSMKMQDLNEVDANTSPIADYIF